MLYGDEKDKGCADVALTLSECLERKIRHAALLEYGRKVNAAIDELISLDHVNAFKINGGERDLVALGDKIKKDNAKSVGDAAVMKASGVLLAMLRDASPKVDVNF